MYNDLAHGDGKNGAAGQAGRSGSQSGYDPDSCNARPGYCGGAANQSSFLDDAALLVAAPFGAAYASARTISLFRAVGPAELADIFETGVFRNLGSAEGKYFTTSGESAASYAKQAVSGFGDPAYTLVETRAPSSILNGLTSATVDRGIPAWVVPDSRLPGLVPRVLDRMPMPTK